MEAACTACPSGGMAWGRQSAAGRSTPGAPACSHADVRAAPYASRGAGLCWNLLPSPAARYPKVPSHLALGTGMLCPAVTGLKKFFGPLCTIGQAREIQAWNQAAEVGTGRRKHMTSETRKTATAAAQPPSSYAPGRRMEGVAAAASVGRKATALEPEHISVPVHQSPDEEGTGQRGGRRDTEVLCYLPSFRQGNKAARREGIREETG